MVKIIITSLLGGTLLFASFDNECISCHSTDKAPQLENLYFRYLQVYGSSKRAQEGMMSYLLTPTIKGSIMPPQALERFGLHPKLNSTTLPTVLNEYFTRYDVKKRLIFR